VILGPLFIDALPWTVMRNGADDDQTRDDGRGAALRSVDDGLRKAAGHGHGISAGAIRTGCQGLGEAE
jgi:hypothetical protein